MNGVSNEHQHFVTGNQSPAPFEHILVATDFSAGAANAIARAGRLPLTEKGRISVVHVLSDSIPAKAVASTEKLGRQHLEQATRSLRKATAKLGHCNVKISAGLAQAKVLPGFSIRS